MNNDLITNKLSERISKSFESQSMMKTIGAKIHKVEKGKVTIEVPILSSTLQQQGYAHAGLTFSIGDSAAGYSALTLMPEDQEVMTAEIKINLLAPAEEGLLRAEGRVVKNGKRLVVVNSEIYTLKNRKKKLIAIMQGTMIPVSVKHLNAG
tara:strand:- start:192 stop:644 length:453 start_codon:yes stop_codon:yes gene_type:complete